MWQKSSGGKDGKKAGFNGNHNRKVRPFIVSTYRFYI